MPSVKNILVVDNNPIVLEFMNTILEENGYSVRTADSGLAALSIIGEFTPDLAFVDLIMPEIDGRRLCSLFRRDLRTRKCIIVVLSAIGAEDPDRAFAAYADAYLAKVPFRILRENVLAVIRDLGGGNTAPYDQTIVGSDMIHHREITKELLFAKKHMDVVLGMAHDGVLELSGDRLVTYASPSACEILGMHIDELLGRPMPEVFPTNVREQLSRGLEEITGGVKTSGRCDELPLDSRIVTVSFRSVTFDDYTSILMILRDVTELVRDRRRVESLLNDKTRLLREIHHRVKNNLNAVSGLLYLHAGRVESPEASRALNDAHGRVTTMLRIYERLFDSGRSEHIELSALLRDILNGVSGTFGEKNVRAVHTPSAHSTFVSTDVSVPIGLIVNELVTNAYKYAFPDRREGTVSVDITRRPDGVVCVTVSDNGIGIPAGVEAHTGEGFGLQLVLAEAEQIGAAVSLVRDNGTRFVITIPAEAFVKPETD